MGTSPPSRVESASRWGVIWLAPSARGADRIGFCSVSTTPPRRCTSCGSTIAPMSTGRGEVRDNERAGARAAPAGRQAKLTDRSTATQYGSLGGPAAPAGRHPMNFVRDVVEAAAPEAVAVVERTHSGDRREHTFAALAERSARLAGTLHQVGVRRLDA